jgi:hypothetical protein
MMKILDFFKRIFGSKIEKTNNSIKEQIYAQETPKNKEVRILSVWDILKFNDNTQAFHLSSVIRFDEWVTMDEIRRRIFELFQIDYQNERSLYPYLKTLVDIGLIESTNIGGKRKWRKKDLLIKIEKEEEEKQEIELKQAANQ